MEPDLAEWMVLGQGDVEDKLRAKVTLLETALEAETQAHMGTSADLIQARRKVVAQRVLIARHEAQIAELRALPDDTIWGIGGRRMARRDRRSALRALEKKTRFKCATSKKAAGLVGSRQARCGQKAGTVPRSKGSFTARGIRV